MVGDEGVRSGVETEIPIHVRPGRPSARIRTCQDLYKTSVGPKDSPPTPVEGHEEDRGP